MLKFIRLNIFNMPLFLIYNKRRRYRYGGGASKKAMEELK